MTELQLIHYSNSSGSQEGILLTEDFDTDAWRIIPIGVYVLSDIHIQANDGNGCFKRLPSSLPTECNLVKR